MSHDLVAPPHDLEHERACLGAMAMHPDAFAEAHAILGGSVAYYHAGHRAMHDCLAALVERGEPVDILTLKAEMDRRGALALVGGVDALRDILESVPTSANAVWYARQVSDLATKRAIRTAALRIVKEIDESGLALSAEDARTMGAEEIARAVERRGGAQGPKSIRDLLVAEFNRLEATEDERPIPTGIAELDALLNGGWYPGKFVVVAARPGAGKTSLALQCTTHAGNFGALVVSLEMGDSELTQWLLAQRAKVAAGNIRRRQIDPRGMERMRDEAAVLADLRLWVDDGARSLSDILTTARRFRAKHKIGLLVVDYLQLVTVKAETKNEIREQQVARISRSLKLLSRDLGIAVMALAQLNRAVESREGHKPRLSDLRESGSIEQDADIVLMIHRDREKQGFNETTTGELLVVKHRGGREGAIAVNFDGPSQTFTGRIVT